MEVVLDVETFLFSAGNPAPRMVVCGFALDDNPVELALREEAIGWFGCLAARPDTIFIGHHIPYDLGVFASNEPELLPTIFRLYNEGRIKDTKTRQQLLDIAQGCFRGYMHPETNKWRPYNYHLADLARRHFGIQMEKDIWRLRYGELDGVPLNQWPDAAIFYAKDDVAITRDVYRTQQVHAPQWLRDEDHQHRSDWWRHLMHCHGLRTEEKIIREIEAHTYHEIGEIKSELMDRGFVRSDGSRNTKAAKARMVEWCNERALPVRLTDKGQVALDAEACEFVGCPDLMAYAEYTRLNTLISKDVKLLLQGVTHPIHSNFGRAATTRSTSGNPNVQNFARMI